MVMQTQLVNFTIPKILLTKVDLLAKKQAQSRAELLREAVRIYLASEEERRRSFAVIRAAARRNNFSEEEAVKLVDEVRDALPMNK